MKDLEDKIEKSKELLKLKVAIGLSALLIGYASCSNKINKYYTDVKTYFQKTE